MVRKSQKMKVLHSRQCAPLFFHRTIDIHKIYLLTLVRQMKYIFARRCCSCLLHQSFTWVWRDTILSSMLVKSEIDRKMIRDNHIIVDLKFKRSRYLIGGCFSVICGIPKEMQVMLTSGSAVVKVNISMPCLPHHFRHFQYVRGK